MSNDHLNPDAASKPLLSEGDILMSRFRVNERHRRSRWMGHLLDQVINAHRTKPTMHRASGDGMETLDRMAESLGAKGPWSVLKDGPQSEDALVGYVEPNLWRSSSNGFVTLSNRLLLKGFEHVVNGFIFDDCNQLIARFSNMKEEGRGPLRTFDEIQELKLRWLADRDFVLQHAEGFEAHIDELTVYSTKVIAAETEAEAERVRIAVESKAIEIGCPDNLVLAAYVLKLEGEIEAMGWRLHELETMKSKA
jgi:hypothetical protein